MRLHGLLREKKPVTDLPVDEALRDQLENFDLARGRLLLELLQRCREGNDLAGTSRRAPLGDRLEAPRMVHVARQDLFPLSRVHDPRIGALWKNVNTPV